MMDAAVLQLPPGTTWLVLIALGLLALGWWLARGRRAPGWGASREAVRPRAFSPRTPVIDIDLCPWLMAPLEQVPRAKAEPYYLILDTETLDALRDDAGPERLSPAVALSWALLDEGGCCLREHSYVLRRSGGLTAEATALHGITQAEMDAGHDPTEVYRLLLAEARLARVVVAHNLPFHLGVITQDLDALGLCHTPLEGLPGLCTMEVGRCMGFKRGRSEGEASYPSLGELFAYLYFGRLDVGYTYRSKTLRDLRLLGASLRQLIGRRLIGGSGAKRPRPTRRE